MGKFYKQQATILSTILFLILLPVISLALPPALEEYLGEDFTEVIYHTGDSLVLVDETAEMCGVHVYDYVALRGTSLLNVTPYNGTAPTGVLALVADSIYIDKYSQINGRGRGYRGFNENRGEGPGGGEESFCCEVMVPLIGLLCLRQYGAGGGSHSTYGEEGDGNIGFCHYPDQGATYQGVGHLLMGSAGGGVNADLLCDIFVDDDRGTNGGAAVLLFASNIIECEGYDDDFRYGIDCSGEDDDDNTYGGGGAGGSIILNSPIIRRHSSLVVRGGFTSGANEDWGGDGGAGYVGLNCFQNIASPQAIMSDTRSCQWEASQVFSELKIDTGFDLNIPNTIYSYDSLYAQVKISNDGLLTSNCNVRLTFRRNNAVFYSETIHIPIMLPGDSNLIDFPEWVVPTLCENNDITAQVELLKPYWDADTTTEVLTKNISLIFKPYFQLPSDSLILDSDTLFFYQTAYENLYVELRDNSVIMIEPSDYYEAMLGFESPFFHIFVDSTSTIDLSGGGGLGGGKPHNMNGYNGDGMGGGMAPPDLSVCGSGGGGGFGGNGGTQPDIEPFVNGPGGAATVNFSTGGGGGSNDTSLSCDSEFNYGGDGGGSININGGSIVINGNLLVNGENGTGTVTGSGGGAGGDIVLRAATIDLTGANIQAVGGNGGAAGDGSGGGGGGGKISFYAGYIDTTNTVISVNGGLCGSTGCNGEDGIISYQDMNIDAYIVSGINIKDTLNYDSLLTPAAYVNGSGYGCFPTFKILCEIDSIGVTIYSDTVIATGVGWSSNVLALFEDWPVSEVALTTLYEIRYQTLLPGDDNPSNDLIIDTFFIVSPDGLDFDDDGVPDYLDNCPYLANDQTDTDGDNRGDPCDNCINTMNYDQADTDGDGIGNVCDNCVFAENMEQDDADSDGIGDLCDNCNSVYNDTQDNSDNDYWGDACDNCPVIDNYDQVDTDADLLGDACDDCIDMDGDGAGDPGYGNTGCSDDNCPDVSNPDQADSDYDGVGDLCDNCPDVPNLSQIYFSYPDSGIACHAYDESFLLPLGEYPDYTPYGVPDIGVFRDGWFQENISGDSAKDTHSGPAAVANALFWLDSKHQYEINPASPPTPEINDNFELITSSGPYDDHDTMNVIDVVNAIATGADTDSTGTEVHELFNYVESYLNGLGLNDPGVTRLIQFPDTAELKEAYDNNYGVVLLLGFWKKYIDPGEPGEILRRHGGNYVTLRGIPWINYDVYVFSDPVNYDCSFFNDGLCDDPPNNLNLANALKRNIYEDESNTFHVAQEVSVFEYGVSTLVINNTDYYNNLVVEPDLFMADIVKGQNCPAEFSSLEGEDEGDVVAEYAVVEYALIISVGQSCDCVPGDANGNGSTNILDITHLIAYLYQSGAAPFPYSVCSGDPNCNCTVNILDITNLIAYLYQNGDAPCDCSIWKSSCGSLVK